MRWIAFARWGAALAAVAGGIGLGVDSARATVMTSLCDIDSDDQCTLQELFNGGSITVNDKVFSDWTLLGEVALAFDDIDVVGLDDGGLDPGPGLRFEANSDALTASFADSNLPDAIEFAFTFTVVAGPGFEIVDNSLELVDFEVTDPAFIQVAEVVLDAGGEDLVNKVVSSPSPTFASIAFAPQPSVNVLTGIAVDASGGGSAALTSFEQRFSQQAGLAIPEPGTLALFGLGLAGIGWLARRGRRRSGLALVEAADGERRR